MFAKLLADSGGADQIVDTIVGRASRAALPWAMAGVGAIIGLPMFFEIGLVLLMPVIYLVARRAEMSIITVGIPTLAGLSAMHGLVPPHPGPLLAIDTLHADLGRTLILGVVVAIPTVIVAGPLFGKLAGRWVDVEPPSFFDRREDEHEGRRPAFGITLATVLLPVVLMMAKAIADIAIDDGTNRVQQFFDVIGNPFIALLLAVVVAMFTFGRGSGMDREAIASSLRDSLAPDRRDLPHRRCRRRLQAGAHRHRDRHPARRLGQEREHLGDPARVAAGRADPARDRLRHDRDDHRLGPDDRPRPGPRCHRGLARRARGRVPGRCSSPTSTMPVSGWSRSTSGSRSARRSSRGR